MSVQGSHSLGQSGPDPGANTAPAAGPGSEPRRGRWTLHGLNNGTIFRLTRRGVRRLPLAVSYAIGHVGTWLAWHWMPATRAALADNLRPLFPDASDRALERHALKTLRAYARDVIDFIRALDASPEQARRLFVHRPADMARFQGIMAQGRGAILVTGHYGNWELGSVAMRRLFDLPLTIVAMAEADEEVNRIRRDIRDALEVETIEVGQSFDTALQIRKRLSENGIVAMLIDRHVDRDRVDVSLLGRRAWFLRAPALMGYLSGAPLVPCFIERAGDRQFALHLGEPIVVGRDAPRDVAIQRAAQQFADALSERIRAHPHYWYHFYPYWKSQEDGFAHADAVYGLNQQS